MKELYNKQIKFQDTVKDSYDFKVEELPSDTVAGFSYHIQHLISEIGEVLTADKRWKSLRKNKYNKEEKLDEIADCFIVLMNVGIFSGFTGEEIEEAISSKIDKNMSRSK